MLGPAIGIAVSLAILLAPLLLDLLSQWEANAAIAESHATSSVEEDPGVADCLRQADAYNAALGKYEGPDVGRILPYDQQLTYGGDEVMAYVEVPVAGIRLPIYHGTDDDALAAGVGHVEGTSLPVGGETSHCVLTAHSGMADSSAFDNLRKVEEGNEVYVTACGRRCAYRVTSIEVVWPEEVAGRIGLVDGIDQLTLVTCTPYGVNDHRLLVHAERTSEAAAQGQATGQEAAAARSPVAPPQLVLLVALWAVIYVCRAMSRHDAR